MDRINLALFSSSPEIGKPPTFTRRHNIEAEVLLPPGIFVIGNSKNGNVTVQSFGVPRTEKTHFTIVKNYFPTDQM
jgi:hypothetical protein